MDPSEQTNCNTNFNNILLVNDIVFEIISYLDAVCVSHFLSISKRVWNLRTHSTVYDRIVPYKEIIKSKLWNQGLGVAASNSNTIQIHYFISKGADNWNQGMFEAAQKGNRYLVDFFVERGACCWQVGLEKASFGGHLDLIEFFITKNRITLELALKEAAKGGHKHVVEFFVQKGVCDWDLGLYGTTCMNASTPAQKITQKELATYFIKQGAKIFYFFVAAIMGKKELIEFIFQLATPSDSEINAGLEGAAREGNIDLVEFFIRKGATDWNAGLRGATYGNQLDLIKFFNEKQSANITALSTTSHSIVN